MFTVIICSADFLANTKRTYSHILEAIGKNEDCSICVWNPSAEVFEEALPNLPKMVAGKAQWRAIVIQDAITFGMESADKRNPFDKVGSIKVLQDFKEKEIFSKLEELHVLEETNNEARHELKKKTDQLIAQSSDLVKEHRQIKKEKYAEAVSNPLTRLGVWLTGIEDRDPDISQTLPEELFSDSTEINRDYYELLLENRALASEIEAYHILKYKYQALTSNFDKGAMIINPPESILAISERFKARAGDSFYIKPGEHEEIEYSNFCDDNLYVGKMRFMFLDVKYENGRRNTKDYLAFLTSIISLSEQELPNDSVRTGKVYKINMRINEHKVIDYYAHFLSKLYRTRNYLQSESKRRIDDTSKEDVSREEALDLFESDVDIPVTISGDFKKEDLMGKHNELGLSTDCPKEEYKYWGDQFRKIMKNFIYYMREPRRALKKSVTTDFRSKNTIDSERARNLNEFQVEDIHYRLIEEEEKMVATKTEAMFNTKQYTEELEKADKEIRKGISQRMTKKKTLFVGLVATVAYFFGFLPLLFGNTNTVESFGFSLRIMGIVLIIFLVVGLIYLFVLRRRLVNRIKHFNYVMSGIINDVERGLDAFSTYLSHACNVMREHSVLNFLKKKDDAKLNVYKKHIVDIEAKIKETEELFVDDASYKFSVYEDEEPFKYDFTVCKDYVYEVPYSESEAEMMFISRGNWVPTTVGYVESITLTREELYD